MLAFSEDDWVLELQDAGRAIWVASLSDGRKVYQDDGRPGLPQSGDSSWQRLRRFLSKTQLSIVWLVLKFRTEWLCPLPTNARGYYYSQGVFALVGGPTWKTVVLGWADDRLHVVTVAVPELEVAVQDVRPITEDRRLILNVG
jgi:hypothetical protein